MSFIYDSTRKGFQPLHVLLIAAILILIALITFFSLEGPRKAIPAIAIVVIIFGLDKCYRRALNKRFHKSAITQSGLELGYFINKGRACPAIKYPYFFVRITPGATITDMHPDHETHDMVYTACENGEWTKSAQLRIVQVLNGKVDGIDREEGVMHVIFTQRKGDGDTTPFLEHLDLKILSESGIDHVCQRFTYTVYADSTAVITPIVMDD